ncbi:DoxX family protein [Paludibacter sp. 221]|uniref:DoxX family protein n=1 Tax=Paludibacter sp. 221 TaxID=2302939 RepID=UPI0013D02500|nr:DoxX family protein [Paludibacter sp. 221]NDV47635.1 DoxX family protein [Paludibacter sp. 221]
MNRKLNNFILITLGKKNVNANDFGLLIFRLAVGILMLTHGLQKIANYETLKLAFPDPIGLGSSFSLTLIILAEFGCSILIILGLFTRLATIPLMFGMIVAGFVVHGGDPFAVKELSVLYLLMYVVLILTGAGKYSVDHYLQRWWMKKSKFA